MLARACAIRGGAFWRVYMRSRYALRLGTRLALRLSSPNRACRPERRPELANVVAVESINIKLHNSNDLVVVVHSSGHVDLLSFSTTNTSQSFSTTNTSQR